jgi:hypothetical protein
VNLKIVYQYKLHGKAFGFAQLILYTFSIDRVKYGAESRPFFKRNTLNAPYFFSFGQDGDSPSLGSAVSATADKSFIKTNNNIWKWKKKS